jgi:DNA primase
MISRETIDEIRSRLDIVDVVGDFVTLKRSGQNYKALSPFSNEKTASFYVVPSKGIFKDFSSGKGGDAITFVMEHEGMSYVETLRYLAKRYSIDLKEDHQRSAEEQSQYTERDSLYGLMNYAKDQFKDLLFNSDDGRGIGLSYFRERGFNDRTIEKFELGYTLDAWDHLSKKALGIGYTDDLLAKAGLIVKRDDGRFYDRFRGRVIFPVHNLSGKVIAFGARILTKDKDQPKYINSPETDIYHKSHVLYGMYQAKNAIRREDFCYIVEGYTDVISMHQAGIDNVVASSGTAFTEEQIKLIRRFTENVTVMFDGDAAGIKAALRGIDLVLKGGLNVRVVLLPDGDDPDSFSRKMATTELKQYLKDHAKDFISFKIDLLAQESGHDPIRRAEAIREIVTSISLIPDPIKRSVYIQETSTLLKMQEAVLQTELNKITLTERQKTAPAEKGRNRNMPGPPPDDVPPIFVPGEDEPVSTNSVAAKIERQERESVRLLVNYSDEAFDEEARIIEFMLAELEDVEFENYIYKEIFTAFLENFRNGVVIDPMHFMEHGTSEVKSMVAELTTRRHEASKGWSAENIHFPEEKEILHDVVYSNIIRLKYFKIHGLIDGQLQKLKQAATPEDEEEQFTIYEQLKGAEKELAAVLGIIVSK